MPRASVLHQRIREQAAVHRLPLDRFRIRAARSAHELIKAFSLLHEAYVGAKLQRADRRNMRMTGQHVLRETVVFVAWDDAQAAGTATVALDSPAGLPLDKDYPEEMHALRQRTGRLAEVGSLAVRAPWRGSSLNLLLGFVCGWAIRRVLGASHAVIGVHPKHAALYRAVFGFEPLGGEKVHADLQAPVTALVLDMRTFVTFLGEHHDRLLENGRQARDEFGGVQPPSCVEVAGALLQRNKELWKLPRRVFQEVFMRQSRHLYALDEATKCYLASQRTGLTLAHAAFELSE